MPIQLDKILSDIAEEKVLHPNYPNAAKKQVDDAWMRVGKKNKLSVHEARSIFKVLQKKYDQERAKDSSAWKLFSVMDEIHKKVEVKQDVKMEEEESGLAAEEDEEYEMLEVQEEEEHAVAGYTAAPLPSTGSASDGESPNKSLKSNSSTGSPEKDEKPLIKALGTPKSVSTASVPSQVEEKKILNSLPTLSTNKYIAGTSAPQTPTAAAAAALQKKGITMKKTTPATPVASTKTSSGSATIKTTPVRSTNALLDVGKTIQLPESLKRKLSEDHSPQQQKRSNLAQAAVAASLAASNQHQNSSSSQTTTQKPIQNKHEREEASQQEQQQQTTHGISLITIPANPTRTELTNGVAVGLISSTARPSSSTAATVASTSTNGFSPRIEDIDFRNDIIFDTGTGNVANGGAQQSVNRVNHQSTEIINLGNFDNSLPPTFFKNLCNSSRHEALGLYVANVMNRLGTRAAAKLELGILRAIIDVQSDELEQ